MPDPHQPLAECYDRWRREGERLAGGLREVARRAVVYRQVFRDSGGNHAFPLIAAHGACWSRGHFARGDRLGWWLAWPHALARGGRAARLAALARFADVFRDINRRVCADTYAGYHFTREHGDHPDAGRHIPAALLHALRRLHAARRAGAGYTTADQRELFRAHFLYEQEHVVGPALTAAVAAFDWPVLRRLALRPAIRFSYFARGRALAFRDFSRRDERVENGLRAFEWAAEAGWAAVEDRLRDYRVLSPADVDDPDRAFAALAAGDDR